MSNGNIILIGTLNEKYRNGGNVFDPKGIAPTLTAAMGMGGHIPLIIEQNDGKEDRTQNIEQR